MIFLQTKLPFDPSMLMFGAMILVIYFFMIRPQQKKQKDQQKFREELKTGDRVVTIGGLHGRIDSMNADTVTLDVGKGMKLTFEKSSISMEASKKLQPVATPTVTPQA
ncbi:MAG: preprotein translocase subunit YajC [Cytophagales bacterium]|jgi:preprotein translocase subunit YajC|nr:preprotein translocase subunit YajC [Cytophagales bacterium]